MARQYIIQSWVGSAEYDEGDSYSGEQIGHRNQKSVEVKMVRSGDNWKAEQPEVWVNGKANVNAFADKPTPKATKKTIDIRDRICPQQKTYERLEQMQKDLEQEFTDGKLSDEEYLSLSAVLDKKLQRAWVLLAKAMNWKEEETEDYGDNSCDFTLEDLHSQDKAVNIKRNRELVGVLGTLNDDNVFRVYWCHWLEVKRFCGVFRKEIKKSVEKTKKFIDYVKAGI